MATDPEIYERTPVRGRDGFDLATSYREERLRSYEGVALPGLPNHFIVFGPYGWIGGTWHQLVEIASAHATRVITAASSDERRVGKECVSTCRSRWSPYLYTNKSHPQSILTIFTPSL